jgi:hypothetical protein
MSVRQPGNTWQVDLRHNSKRIRRGGFTSLALQVCLLSPSAMFSLREL